MVSELTICFYGIHYMLVNEQTVRNRLHIFSFNARCPVQRKSRAIRKGAATSKFGTNETGRPYCFPISCDWECDPIQESRQDRNDSKI